MKQKKSQSKDKTSETNSPGLESQQTLASDERHAMIAEAAYFIALQREFDGNATLDDWLQAEIELSEQFTAEEDTSVA